MLQNAGPPYQRRAVIGAPHQTLRGYFLQYTKAQLDDAITQTTELQTAAAASLSSSATSETQIKYTYVDTAVESEINFAIHFTNGNPSSSNGVSVPKEVQDAAGSLKKAGLYVYIMAAQADVTRLSLLALIDAKRGEQANLQIHRQFLHDRLGTYIDYVRGELRSRVESDMMNLVNSVEPCSIIWDPNPDGTVRAWWGVRPWRHQEQASNVDVADARCNGSRDQYIMQLEQQAAEVAAYGAANTIVDQWAVTRDAVAKSLGRTERNCCPAPLMRRDEAG